MRRSLLLLFICVQFLQSQPPSPTPTAKRDEPQRPTTKRGDQSSNNKRGTEQSPIFVKVLPSSKTQDESPNDKNEALDKSSADWWMVRLTAAIAVIGLIQTIVFGVQAYMLRQTISKMDEIASGQSRDVQASIAEATRAATAMEGVATSMATNAESVRKSVAISREIADTQKLVTELQSRPYLSVAFDGAIFQDASHVFEVRATLHNSGNTPAYDVTFRATAEIVSLPIANDFPFPLPSDTAGVSVSFIAPGTRKIITRRVRERVRDEEVDPIKYGNSPRGLAMWGIVKYRDAFKKSRQLRFAFTVQWIAWIKGMGRDKDGNPLPEQIMSWDTERHNDAD